MTNRPRGSWRCRRYPTHASTYIEQSLVLLCNIYFLFLLASPLLSTVIGTVGHATSDNSEREHRFQMGKRKAAVIERNPEQLTVYIIDSWSEKCANAPRC